MGTYYNYVERTADNYVNWAEIGKSMTDMLKETERVRNEKKATLDEALRQDLDYYRQHPTGESGTARQMALDYSNDVQQYTLDLHRKLKSGEITLNDYLTRRQNINDGTKVAFNMLSEYQKQAGTILDKWRKGELSIRTVENWKQIEKFGKFANSGLSINPYTGQVNAALKKEQVVNGEKVFAISKNPEDIMSVNALNNLMVSEYSKYDYGKDTDLFAKQMGKNVEMLKRAGYTGSITDITSRKYTDEKSKKMIFDFQDAEKKLIEAMISDENKKSSILVDNSVVCSTNGKLYRMTYDPTDAKNNPEAILYSTDTSGIQTVTFTKAQNDDAFNFMRDDVRRKYDYIEEAQRVTSSGSYSPRPSKYEVNQTDIQGLWNQIYWGNKAQKQAAIQSIVNSNAADVAGIVDISIDPSNKKINYTQKDKEGNLVQKSASFDPATTTYGEFAVQGSLISGIQSASDAVRAGENPYKLGTGSTISSFLDKAPEANMFENVTAKKTVTSPTESKATAAKKGGLSDVKQILTQSLLASSFTTKEDDLAKQINDLIKGFGYYADVTGGTISNEVTLYDPNGKVVAVTPANIYGSPTSTKQKFIDAIQAVINQQNQSASGGNAR